MGEKKKSLARPRHRCHVSYQSVCKYNTRCRGLQPITYALRPNEYTQPSVASYRNGLAVGDIGMPSSRSWSTQSVKSRRYQQKQLHLDEGYSRRVLYKVQGRSRLVKIRVLVIYLSIDYVCILKRLLHVTVDLFR